MNTRAVEPLKQKLPNKVDVAYRKLQRGELVDLLADVDAGIIKPEELKEALDRQWANPWFRFRQFFRTIFERVRF